MLYRGRQTLAHLLIGFGAVALVGEFSDRADVALGAAGFYALGREIEDAVAGDFDNLGDSFRDMLEIFAGALGGIAVRLLFGLF